MATLLAASLVLLTAFYLIGLGTLAAIAPARAASLLGGLASTLRVHVLELSVRCAVGAAFVHYGGQMQFPSVFVGIGWVLVITTLGLAVLPWRWHQQFARRTVPMATRYPRLLALPSIAAGSFVLWSVALGSGRV